MKNVVGSFALLAGLAIFMVSCDKKDDTTTPPPNQNQLVELSGDLTTRTLTADKKYLLKGQVFVRSGQTLTIEPGTVIFGDKRTKGTLIIDKGGRIIANGTVDKPIVMTSSQEAGIRDRGDWGGLIILGRANVNQPDPTIEGITPPVTFGTQNNTTNDGENSGSLRYVRIEFAGIELTPNNETNSLTTGGVGRATVIEYVQVSYGGDDGFEFFGGTHNARYLVSLGTWDDDFDIDYGYSGNIQFGVAIRYPSFADQSQSNGIETDNGPNDNDVQPYTNGVLSNITIIGPLAPVSPANPISANYGFAADFRRRVALSVFNSVFVGFPRGIRFNQASVVSQYQSGRGVLANNILWAPSASVAYQAGTGVVADSVKAYWEAPANGNSTTTAAATDAYTAIGVKADLFFGNRLRNDYPSNPDFTVTSGTAASGAKFDHPKFNEANRREFFTNVTHRGAFGNTDWTDRWAEFDPVDKVY
ncbi:MAG: hypothetical protein NZM43_00515 [Saprospiraceae bacterium]|nr:hypothetical protein [Saprospiraceae bacterium]MDW8482784.1 hypothetical protein [Saprospiraceae bacterium]